MKYNVKKANSSDEIIRAQYRLKYLENAGIPKLSLLPVDLLNPYYIFKTNGDILIFKSKQKIIKITPNLNNKPHISYKRIKNKHKITAS